MDTRYLPLDNKKMKKSVSERILWSRRVEEDVDDDVPVLDMDYAVKKAC